MTWSSLDFNGERFPKRPIFRSQLITISTKVPDRSDIVDDSETDAGAMIEGLGCSIFILQYMRMRATTHTVKVLSTNL